MIFAFGGVYFQNIAQTLQQWGVLDILVPFALIFAITYAVVKKANIFESERLQATVAVSIALLTVLPHALGAYPEGVDVVKIINAFLPQIALVLVTLVIVLMMFGLAGATGADVDKYKKWGAYAAIIIVLMLLLNLIPQWGWNQFTFLQDPDLLSLIVGALVFGLVVRWIMGSGLTEDETKGREKASKKARADALKREAAELER